MLTKLGNAGSRIGALKLTETEMKEMIQCGDFVNHELRDDILKAFSQRFGKKLKHVVRVFVKTRTYLVQFYGVTDKNEIVELNF